MNHKLIIILILLINVFAKTQNSEATKIKMQSCHFKHIYLFVLVKTMHFTWLNFFIDPPAYAWNEFVRNANRLIGIDWGFVCLHYLLQGKVNFLLPAVSKGLWHSLSMPIRPHETLPSNKLKKSKNIKRNNINELLYTI